MQGTINMSANMHLSRESEICKPVGFYSIDLLDLNRTVTWENRDRLPDSMSEVDEFHGQMKELINEKMKELNNEGTNYLFNFFIPSFVHSFIFNYP